MIDYGRFREAEEVADEILARSVGNNDYAVTLHDFVASMTSLDTASRNGEEVILTPSGFAELVRGRLGINPVVFKNDDVSVNTRLQYLREATLAKENRGLWVRMSGNRVESVLSDQYEFFDNRSIGGYLKVAKAQGNLPNGCRVMSCYISKSGRNLDLRLTAPEWEFEIPENGKTAPFMGNFMLANNELGRGSFSARVAITRHACLNSTIGQKIFTVDHRFANRNKFFEALGGGIGQITEWSKLMGEQMDNLRQVPIEAPMLIFEKIGEENGVPKYAVERARDYWQEHGERNRLYDIVQAFAAGAQGATDVAGTRREPRWEKRAQIESGIWETGMALQKLHLSGQSVEDWYYTDDMKIRERAANLVLGYRSDFAVAERVAEDIRHLEV